jgi:hypothetical protein
MAAQATYQDKTTPLSALFRDSYLRAVFARAERDTPPAAALVEPRRPEPVLSGTDAVRVLELA